MLLGYSFADEKLELHLLSLGSHENFYRDSKRRPNTDMRLIRLGKGVKAINDKYNNDITYP